MQYHPRYLRGPASLLVLAATLLAGCSKQSNELENQAAEKETAVALAGDVCAAHGAPKELCFICDPALREKGRLWCREHARYEDRCWECHPELEDKARLYCKEHSLYEDECFLCHPELLETKAPASEEKPRAAVADQELMCIEHGVFESECGICHPDLIQSKKTGEGLKVRLPAMASAGQAGVEAALPEKGSISEGVSAFAQVTFNQNRLAHLTPLVHGVVKTVEVDLGSKVRKGDLLARITSVEIGDAQSDYLKAAAEAALREQALKRERELRSQSISSEKELQEAEAAHRAALAGVRAARQQLLVLGLDEPQIQALGEAEITPGVLEVRAPFDGEIIDRMAVPGSMAELGKPLFTLADLSSMWAMLNVPESQLQHLSSGQTVELTLPSYPGEIFRGTLTWISAEVDERTRMARGRVELPNGEGKLKARMFADARILTGSAGEGFVVPEPALQSLEGKPVVFVKLGEDLFEARSVLPGPSSEGRVQLLAGLDPGESVVVHGAFRLKSQFLLSRLGAGCVDH